jgi:hypothetical protein
MEEERYTHAGFSSSEARLLNKFKKPEGNQSSFGVRTLLIID